MENAEFPHTKNMGFPHLQGTGRTCRFRARDGRAGAHPEMGFPHLQGTGWTCRFRGRDGRAGAHPETEFPHKRWKPSRTTIRQRCCLTSHEFDGPLLGLSGCVRCNLDHLEDEVSACNHNRQMDSEGFALYVFVVFKNRFVFARGSPQSSQNLEEGTNRNPGFGNLALGRSSAKKQTYFTGSSSKLFYGRCHAQIKKFTIANLRASPRYIS